MTDTNVPQGPPIPGGSRPGRGFIGAGRALAKARLKASAPRLYRALSRNAVLTRILHRSDPRQEWWIDIFGGDDLGNLRPLGTGPAVTRLDVNDVAAEYVADPFLVLAGGLWHLFFEVLNARRNKGEIAFATSADLVRWQYRGIVLRERHHLSYPAVFSHEGAWYMVPETWEASAVWLYRAEAFPWGWRRHRRLLSGKVLLDPTLFRHHGLWWMIVETDRSHRFDTLRLFMANTLTGPWSEHPASPIVAGDARIARPAGRAIIRNGRPIRFAQNCADSYGASVSAFEMVELSPTTYREQRLALALAPGPNSGFVNGMHHVDAFELDGRWIAAVDGR